MLLLGIDLGTTGTKAVVVDERGRVIASATREHPLSTPRAGWSEQDPEEWWRSAIGAVRAALATTMEFEAGICISEALTGGRGGPFEDVS